MAAAFPILGISVYVWIALISLLFLVVLASFGGYGFDVGGDVDAGVDVDYGEFAGPGISPVSPPLLAAFGTSFGAVGYLLELQGYAPAIVAAVASATAALIAVGLFVSLQRFLVRAQASSDVRPSDLVGRDAHVMIPIQRGAQGQILVITEARGRTLFPAIADADIGRDVVVEILGFSGGVASVRKKTG